MQSSYRLSGRVIGLGPVLQQAYRFLLPKSIGDEAEAGSLTLYFLTTPALKKQPHLKHELGHL